MQVASSHPDSSSDINNMKSSCDKICCLVSYASLYLETSFVKLAIERWEVTHSDFLTPPAIDDALKVLKRLSDIGVVVSGGYPQVKLLFQCER